MNVGLIDDAGACITWDEIAKGLGDFSDPRPLLMALYGNRQKYCDFSVTELLDEPCAIQMKRRYDYYECPNDMMDMLLGSGVHALLQARAPVDAQAFAEHKMTRQFEGDKGQLVSIGGTLDFIDGDTLWDYKVITTGKLGKLVRGNISDDKYADQVNFYYALLPGEMRMRITKAYIRFIVRDWRFYEFKKLLFNQKKYPRGGVLPVTLNPEADTLAKMGKLVKQHTAAERLLDEKLTPCDTWGGLRCNHYCSVSSVCVHRVKEKEETNAEVKHTENRKPGPQWGGRHVPRNKAKAHSAHLPVRARGGAPAGASGAHSLRA